MNFITIYSDHTPKSKKKEFVNMKVEDGKDKIMDLLKGFEGIDHPNFWLRYKDKKFGHLFVKGFKSALLQIVMSMET